MVLNSVVFNNPQRIDLYDKKSVEQGYITQKLYDNYHSFHKGDCTDEEMEGYICGPDYCPIICGQDLRPSNPSLQIISFEEDKAVVSAWGEIKYTVRKEGGKWKLDDTSCFK